jgi:outer membrane protein assembly factor BamB
VRNHLLLLPILGLIAACSGESALPSTTPRDSLTTVADSLATTSTVNIATTMSRPREVCHDVGDSAVPLTEPASNGVELWDFYPDAVQHRVSPQTSATAADGVVYVGASGIIDQGSLHALFADGKVAWSYRHGGHTPSKPSVSDGLVFVGSEDHNLYAIDTETGEETWRFSTNGHIRIRPAVGGDTVVVTSKDGFIYALDTNDGDLRWSHQVDERVSDSQSTGSTPPSPAVDQDAAYVVATEGSDWTLSAFDMNDGDLRWQIPVEQQVFRSPRTGSGMVFLAAGALYGIDADSGDILWMCTAEGNFLSEPFPTSTAVYATSSDGFVYALDPFTGVLVWRVDTEIVSLESPTVEEDVVYVPATQGQLLALSSDGVLLSRYDLATGVSIKPHAVVEGVVYVVTRTRHLYAIDMFP